jgi:hypothetical protein
MVHAGQVTGRLVVQDAVEAPDRMDSPRKMKSPPSAARQLALP